MIDGIATLRDGREVSVRVAERNDASAIIGLYNTIYDLEVKPDQLSDDIDIGHAVVAHAGDRLVAFRYQRRLNPDVLGDGAMVVAIDYWRCGLGRTLVEYFEACLPPKWKVSIVVNSTAYETKVPKPDAQAFWLACGYSEVADTGRSRIFIKQY